MTNASFRLTASDGYKVTGVKWIPSNEINAIMILAHGMAEIIDRYDEFATFLVDNGIAVYGYNQRGHGPQASPIGHLNKKEWILMRTDLEMVSKMAIAEYPMLPCFILGHSMGSFLLRDLMNHTDLSQYTGIILSGVGFPSKIELVMGRLFSRLNLLFYGRMHRSNFINKVVFGNNNKNIESPKTSFDWLTRDEKIVNDYIDSPYCGNIHTSGFFNEFFSSIYRTLYSEKTHYENLPKMMIFSGASDPVGDYGKGSQKTTNDYILRGVDVTYKLYPDARHELLNEINRKEIYQTVLVWIQKQMRHRT